MDNMTGSFRSEVFGGFNRKDVSVYIEKLAAERNKYKGDAEKLGDKVEELSDTIAELETRISELSKELDTAMASVRITKRQEEAYRLSAISKAESIVNTLENKYGILREEIIASTARLRAELCDAGDRIAGLSSQLETAEETFSPLRSVLTENSEPEQYADMLTESDGEDTEASVYVQRRMQQGDMLMESDGEDMAEDAEVSFASLRRTYPEIKWEKNLDE